MLGTKSFEEEKLEEEGGRREGAFTFNLFILFLSLCFSFF